MIKHSLAFLLFTLFLSKVEGAKYSSSPTPVCGNVTGCLSWPPGCPYQNCKVLLEFFYQKQAKVLNVMISVKSSDWIAFGYNLKPRIMGGTAGQICMKSKSKAPVLKSFENKGTDFDMKELDWQIKQFPSYSSNTNGWLICRFRTPVKGHNLTDLTKPWYIVASWGKTKMKGSKIHAREHSTGDYFWTQSKVFVTDKTSFPATTFGWGLIATHGSFMVLAWVGFAFSGIFYARYMRDTLHGKTTCGAARWFQFHQVFMLCSTVLAIIAFIFILVEAKGWNTEMEAHPILGVITIVLAIVQTVAGMFRPAVNSPRKFLFKISHQLNGIVTYILAIVTMFLGLAAMDVDFTILILYLVVILFTFLGFWGYRLYKSRTVAEVPYQGSQLDSAEGSEASDDVPSQMLSSREIFTYKISGWMVIGLGFAIALVLISLIGHKGYVYEKKTHL